MEIKWLGHSCFRISHGGYSVILDPYDPEVPGYRELHETANAVLCSHDHHDHNWTQAVTIEKTGADNPFVVDAIGTFHDPERGKLRGRNTIHVLSAGDIRIAHMGDLGCELGAIQKSVLRGLDAILCPVGGFYTIDAQQAKALVDELQPGAIIPMHYRTERFGFDVIGTLEDFTSLFDPARVTLLDTDTLEITHDMGGGVFVPQYPET